jgi:catechol 2,3-dioxygenase-like lactoylglutathione lyase family enzyme
MTTTSLSFASVFSADIEKLSTFYGELLGLDEVLELRSEHFRGLYIGDTILGFSALTAYKMLNLPEPQEKPDSVSTFLTFEMPTDADVDSATSAAVDAGATCVKRPGRTYYGAWQSVLLDPDGNAFRLNHLTLQAHS